MGVFPSVSPPRLVPARLCASRAATDVAVDASIRSFVRLSRSVHNIHPHHVDVVTVISVIKIGTRAEQSRDTCHAVTGIPPSNESACERHSTRVVAILGQPDFNAATTMQQLLRELDHGGASPASGYMYLGTARVHVRGRCTSPTS